MTEGRKGMEFLVLVGPDAGQLGIEERMQLADSGFCESAQVHTSKAIWPSELGFSTGLDVPDDLLEAGAHWIAYRYEADDEASAASDALAIVGGAFTVRVKAPVQQDD